MNNRLLTCDKRDVTLDAYKGVLIILVVIRHVLQYSVSDEGGILTNFIWAVQMPGFMLISGYFNAKVVVCSSDLLNSALKSTEKYLLPFLSWQVLISVLLLGKCDRNPLTGLATLMRHVDNGLWFLWVIYVLSIVFALCNLIVNKAKNGPRQVVCVLVVWCMFCCFLFVVSKFFGIDIFGIKFILYYSLFYGLGWTVNNSASFWKSLITGNIKQIILFVCFSVFIAICFNYDLYHCDDNLMPILLRFVAGITGNVVILATCNHFKCIFEKFKISWIGTYSLEIYATHTYVNHLFIHSSTNPFFTLAGFGNFAVSLFCTVVFTVIIIAVIKSIPVANFILYGKRSKR